MKFQVFLDKFERFNRVISSAIEWIGVVALLILTAITVADIVGSKAFLTPVPGSVDIVGLSQLIAISFAGASAQLVGRHIRVEFFIIRIPFPIQRVINSIIYLFLIAFFILVIWRSMILGQSLHDIGQSSSTARIPLYPFPYAIAFAFLPLCFIYIVKFLREITQERTT